MKKTTIIAGIAAMAFTLTQTVQAVPITGSIGFTGGATIDTSSMGTATEILTWINPVATLDYQTFSSVAFGTPASIAGNWSFNDSTPITGFWKVGIFTFNLTSSYIFQQGGVAGSTGYVVVDGMGTVSAPGYDDTAMAWSFTAQDPAAGQNPASWTFSASSNSLPDGGATVMMLGIALSGVTLLKKKLKA